VKRTSSARAELRSVVKPSASRHDHFEIQVEGSATLARVFALLEDHRRTAAHKTEPAWRMAGSQMTIEMDERQGGAVGSRITLSGKILGCSLKVEEIATLYDVPHAKVWKTVGSPRRMARDAATYFNPRRSTS